MEIPPLPLMLGTASFGMPYGIANPPGSLSADTVEAMLDLAWEGGIRSFDTAPAYGEAEARLGRWIKRRGVVPVVSTKLPALAQTPDADLDRTISEALEGSTRRLGQRPDIYLTHSAADYLRPPIRNALRDLAGRGKVGKIGPSVYTGDEIMDALAAGPPEAIQLPVSAFDHRIADSGALAACAAAGVAVFARSVFLQGVLLMEPGSLPPVLEPFGESLAAFETYASSARSTRVSMALRYVRDLPGLTATVIGAYTPDQLSSLMAAARQPALSEEQRIAISGIAKGAPAELLDPRTWRKKGAAPAQRA